MRDAVQALFNDAARPDARRAWRTAQSLKIDEQDLPLVRKVLRERLNTMFAWITDELNSARWRRDNGKANSGVRVGLSGFSFEETLPKGAANEIVKKAQRTKP
jgi:ribosomal protein L31E